MGGALEGYCVLDLTHYVAGPYCTRLLAGLGAAVIKVEKPGEGDGARRLGPFFQDDLHPEKSGLFLYLNGGKKGITLNLKTTTGVKLFKELAKGADVLVENFEPRVMPSLGLGYETLRETNPRLVMTSISNFGQSGPYRDFKATEIVAYALSGMMFITGEPGREPLMEGTPITQYLAGQTAFVATLGALFHREVNGEGQHVDVSIMDHAVTDMPNHIMMYPYLGYIPVRIGNLSEKGHPWGVLPCKDGWVAMVGQDTKWATLADLGGAPELLDERFSSRAKRLEHRDEIDTLLLPWLVDHTREELFEMTQQAKIPSGFVRDIEEVFHCPQMRARDFFVTVDHPFTGPLEYPGGPFALAETPWQPGRAPLLGEHNEEVFGTLLGLPKEDLVHLRECEVL